MANVAGKLVMKLLTIAIGIPVGIVSKKAIDGLWSGARSDAPRKPSEPGVRWRDAIGWAALSAAGMVVADLLTRKGARRSGARSWAPSRRPRSTSRNWRPSRSRRSADRVDIEPGPHAKIGS
jgi:hypothetical protein